MSDYLRNLVTRSLNMSNVIQPRLASLFEPPGRDNEPILPTLPFETEVQTGYPMVSPGRDRFPEPTQTPAHSQAVPLAEMSPPITDQMNHVPVPRSPGYVEIAAPDFSREPRPGEPLAVITAVTTPRPKEAWLAQPATAVRETTAHPPTDTIGRHQPTGIEVSVQQGTQATIQAIHPSTKGPSPTQPRVIPDLRPAAPPAPMVPARVSIPERQPAPTIQVTIGRIEVRATPSSASPPQPRRSIPPMSLEEYLRAKRGER
jgi:hypothetical protein